MTEHWYRYDDVQYSQPIDEFGDKIGPFKPRIKVVLHKIPVRRHTPKGAWLGYSSYDERFVLTNAKKRYACPTIDEARTSFIARKNRQRKILRSQLKRTEKALTLINKESS